MYSRKLSSYIVLIFLAISLVGLVSAQDKRVIIEFKENSKRANTVFSVQDEEIISNIKYKFGNKNIAILSEEEIKKLRENPSVKSVTEENTYQIFLQDAVPQIEGTTAWNLKIGSENFTGAGQTVCIIDTGVNYTHLNLGGCYGNNNLSSSCKVIGGWDFCSDDNDCTTEDSDPMDVEGHGTHVSGIVSAEGNMRGVASDSKIIMIKAANATGTFWETELERAIDWCVNNASKFNISVISMSLGGGQYNSYCNSNSLANEINSAVSENISVVIATGNTGGAYSNPLLGISSPACVQTATRVSAVTKSDVLAIYAFRNSFFSDILLAPGSLINSTSISGSYVPNSGTSMATPMVAGAIAIINQVLNLTEQTRTPSEIEALLYNLGKQITDSLNTSQNYSRINVYEAILSLDNIAPNVTLIYPIDNTVNLTQNQTLLFNTTDWQLKNATIYIWNYSSLWNSSSVNLTGNENSSSFYLTNMPYGTYEWNIFSSDVNNNSAFATQNFSLIIGGVSVEVIEPADNLATTSNETNFSCSARSDPSYNLTNITFYISNSTSSWNETRNLSGSEDNETVNFTFSEKTDYSWNCVAKNNNSQNATSRDYSLTYEEVIPVVQRSGGGGGSSKRIIVPSVSVLELEKIQTVSLNETKQFNFAGVNHTVKINEILNKSANITIQSEPVNFILAIDEERKINLSSPKYFDLIVKLESISENKLNLTLRVIYEPIPAENETEIQNESERILIPLEIKKETKEKNYLIWIILSIFIVLAAVIERKLNQKRLKSKSIFKGYEKTKA